MEQITTEQRLRIFAAYAPCEVRMPLNEGCEVHGVNFESQTVLVTMNYGYSETWLDIKRVILILKPLSSIDDEDAISIGRMVGKTGTWAYLIHCGQYHAKTNCIPVVCDFLRSKGYDCGFGSIPSLISAGIAVSQPQKNE